MDDDDKYHYRNSREYFQLVFGTTNPSRKRIENALEKAHEIRKFEIELYWKRSLYFWGFMVALFTGFAIILNPENPDDTEILKLGSLLITYLGVFISIAWYYLEKGAKAYHSNWEFHIDYLEYPITGHLHKTLIGDRSDYFSVSKINSSIIVAIGFFWVIATILIGYTSDYSSKTNEVERLYKIAYCLFEEEFFGMELWFIILIFIFLASFWFARDITFPLNWKFIKFGYWRSAIPSNNKDVKIIAYNKLKVDDEYAPESHRYETMDVTQRITPKSTSKTDKKSLGKDIVKWLCGNN